jgi:hypothetical protein
MNINSINYILHIFFMNTQLLFDRSSEFYFFEGFEMKN